MSDDQNKSYQDGLHNQPYNGRNWDQWVSGNNARQGASQNNYYSGPKPSTIKWPEPTKFPERDHEANAGAGKGLLFLLLLPVAVVGIGIIALSAILGIVATPLLKMAERIMGSTERKGFGSAYVTTVKALSAFGITFCGMGFIVYLLAKYIFSNLFITNVALLVNVVFYSLVYHRPIPAGAIIDTLIYFGLPSLAAFAYVLNRDYQTTYSGFRGFLRGMATGLPIVGISLLLSGLFYTLTVP